MEHSKKDSNYDRVRRYFDALKTKEKEEKPFCRREIAQQRLRVFSGAVRSLYNFANDPLLAQNRTAEYLTGTNGLLKIIGEYGRSFHNHLPDTHAKIARLEGFFGKDIDLETEEIVLDLEKKFSEIVSRLYEFDRESRDFDSYLKILGIYVGQVEEERIRTELEEKSKEWWKVDESEMPDIFFTGRVGDQAVRNLQQYRSEIERKYPEGSIGPLFGEGEGGELSESFRKEIEKWRSGFDQFAKAGLGQKLNLLDRAGDWESYFPHMIKALMQDKHNRKISSSDQGRFADLIIDEIKRLRSRVALPDYPEDKRSEHKAYHYDRRPADHQYFEPMLRALIARISEAKKIKGPMPDVYTKIEDDRTEKKYPFDEVFAYLISSFHRFDYESVEKTIKDIIMVVEGALRADSEAGRLSVVGVEKMSGALSVPEAVGGLDLVRKEDEV